MTATAELSRREAVTSSRVTRLERMLEIRALEDRIQQLFGEGLIHGTTHTAQGQEAVAVGIASSVRYSDSVACTYRGHGIALALGMRPETVLGEIMGRTPGPMGGVGGSMHLSSPELGLLPTFAIVGAGIPVAAGAALTAQVKGTDDIAVSVFGDGASNIGAFHEGLNLAAIWRLPVLFIIENNVYGEYSRIDHTTPVEDLAVRGSAYGMASEIVDGQDVDQVHAAVSRAVEKIRDGGGPMLLEMKTYRYAGHSRSDAAEYRPQGELDSWLERDPIDRFEERLIDEGALTPDQVRALRAGVASRIEDAVETVKSSPEPTLEAMFANVWAT